MFGKESGSLVMPVAPVGEECSSLEEFLCSSCDLMENEELSDFFMQRTELVSPEEVDEETSSVTSSSSSSSEK